MRQGRGETGRKDERWWMNSCSVVDREGYGASPGGELQSQPEE